MPESFETWDYNKAQAALNDRQKKGDAESLAYVVEKDNWQDAKGWSGPQITGGDPSTTNTIKEGINRDFTPKGAIPSVVRRHRRGVVGREPAWIVSLRRKVEKVINAEGKEEEKLTDQERALIEDADSLLLEWWNQQRGLNVFRKAVNNYATVGRGALRLYWPPASLKDGRMPTLTFEEAIEKIFLLAPKPSEATVITDTWSMKRAGVYTFEDENGKSAIGLCYVNEAKQTVLKTLKQGGASQSEQAKANAGKGVIESVRGALAGQDGNSAQDTGLALNGKLTLFEMEGEALITDAVRRQQKLLDKSGTIVSHNMDEAGFRKEVFLNTMPPGKTIKVDDPDNPGQKIDAFVAGAPSSLPDGAGAKLFAQGTSFTERDEATGQMRTHLATPGHKVVDPVPVDNPIKAATFAAQNILEDTDQLHVMIAGDATANGVSRQQARDDYEKSLDETASEVNYVGSSVMETFLSLVAIFAGKPGCFDGIRVSFEARIDPGPLAPDDRRLNIEERDAGIISTEEAMQRANVSDPDAMDKKIKEEKAEAPPAPSNPLVPPPVDDRAGDSSPVIG
jgi:hypothetical protein